MANWDKLASQHSIQNTIKALKRSGIEAVVVSNSEEAKRLVLELIPKGSEVMTMTSTTLDSIGLSGEINKADGKFKPVRDKLYAMDRNTQVQEMNRLGAAPEFVVGSVHAVTEDGHVLIASNTGSQLPAYSFGALHVIWVVGAQKIVKNTDDGNGDGDDGNGGGDDGNGGNGVVGGKGGVSNPLGCWMNFQLYGRADDRQIDAAYVAAAWSAENPDVVSVGEGEVMNLYSVSNGVAASPPGQTFVAIATGGLGDVDGYGTTYKCSGYMMANLYDAAGQFIGHPRYTDSGTFGKGFHAVNSGESIPLDFLDMGFSLP